MKLSSPFFALLLLSTSFIMYGQSPPSYSITISSPQSQGYYFLVPTKIGAGAASINPVQMILDHTGRLIYYKTISNLGSGEFKLQPNGLISYTRQNKFYLMDSTFTVIDSVAPKNGLLYDAHDLQILPNGHFVLLGNENVTMNLSSYNYFNNNNSPGSATASVKCGVIQEQDINQNVVFEWHCKDHYNFSDVDPFFLSSPTNVDWTHLNAVEYDSDGNYLLSVRHFNEITKIKRSDSTILWRLGGNANQFTFPNDPQKFKGQHDIRRIANGNITLFDNGRLNPLHPATAKEYLLNETNLTANLIWSYVENSSTFSRALGNHQRLSNGNTLVNYGILNNLNQVFNVVTPAGGKVFEIIFSDTLRTYRAFNYPSLPWDLKQPLITCHVTGSQSYLDAGSGYTGYQWSTGATTQTILATASGTYAVFVPKGQGGFISSALYTINNVNELCGATYLNELNNEKGFDIFPNPFNNELIVSFKHDFNPEEILLFDAMGNNIPFSFQTKDLSVEINTTSLGSGIYLLKLGERSKKIIKL